LIAIDDEGESVNTIAKNPDYREFDKDMEPALTINSGEEVTFETFDPLCSEVRTAEQFMEFRAENRRLIEQGKKPLLGNPITGPVYVKGAEPGQTLVAEITAVKLDADGFQLIGPNRAIVEDEVPDWTCYQVDIEGDDLKLPNGVELPIQPVIGTFGNAPAGEITNLACRSCGNYDVPAATIGSKLYIPIEVPGALFSLGDVHACQGDGEVVGAPEIGAHVTARLTVLDHKHSDWMMIEDEENWYTPCPGADEYQAARRAVFHNGEFISKKYDVEFKDALIVLTMIGKLALSRTGKWGDNEPIACSSFSKKLVEKAVGNYRRTD